MEYCDLVETQVFQDYPDVERFIRHHESPYKSCLVTNCNDGFIVDVYQDKKVEAYLH